MHRFFISLHPPRDNIKCAQPSDVISEQQYLSTEELDIAMYATTGVGAPQQLKLTLS